MSITVNFTTESKRENSTKQVTYSDEKNCTFKNGCSMLNPTLILEIDSDTFPTYTGFKIENRRYNITDIRSVRHNLFEIDGKIDALATWKSDILNSSQFVAYSASNYNKYITDNRVGTSNTKRTIRTVLEPTLSVFSEEGCYIIGVIDNNADGLTGTISYYALSDASYELLMAEINGDSWIETFLNNVKYAFQNPMDAIVSSIWVPIQYRRIVGVDDANITLINTRVISATGKRISNPRIAVQYTANGYNENDNYLDLSPFVTHAIYLPFVGNVTLDLDAAYPNYPQIRCEIDILTGNIAYRIEVTASDGQAILSTYSGQCGVNIPINNQTIESASLLTGIVATIGGVLLAQPETAFAAALMASSALPAAAKSAELHSQTNGALSSRVGAFLGLNPIQTTIISEPTEPFGNSRLSRGLPLFQRISLANLTGFVQTIKASVNGAMTSEERSAINNLLDNGIFIE